MKGLGKTRVLTNWKPSRLDVKTIQLEMRVVLGSLLLSSSIPDVRSPRDHRKLTDLHTLGWHQDNAGQDCYLALWSNVLPTEVRFRNGRTLNAKAGDVLLVHNSAVRHRMPERASRTRSRWFARTCVTTFD